MAEVQDDFENNVHHLTFYIPKGEAGLQGPRGEQGIPGTKGNMEKDILIAIKELVLKLIRKQ